MVRQSAVHAPQLVYGAVLKRRIPWLLCGHPDDAQGHAGVAKWVFSCHRSREEAVFAKGHGSGPYPANCLHLLHVMTTFCVMKLLWQATRNENRYAKRLFGTLLAQTPQKRVFSPFWMVVPDPRKSAVFGLAQPFCTAEKSHTEPKRKTAFGSVGRRIPYRILHVINQDGESLGNMHRAEALKLMDQHDLKLVLLRENVEPPVYRLMTGQQIHEEQLRRAEKKKASPKTGMVQKELSFSSAIAKNDLETKTKQIAQWIEKKHHVKITIRQAKDSNTDMFVVFDQILETVSDKATYLSKPKLSREGVSTCILRHMSDKELKAYQKMEKQKSSTVKKDENEDLESSESHQ